LTNNLLGSILIVSGPSGSGKTSICKKVCEDLASTVLSLSTTTRDARETEEDGIDYHFVSKSNFMKDISNGNFLEWAEVHDNFYGTSKIKVEESLKKGKTIIFDIDVQGHASIRKEYPNITTSVFITTQDLNTLKERLSGRGTDDNDIIEKRLINAFIEMKYIKEYDYLIINDTFEESIDALKSIAVSLKYKEDRINIENFTDNWKKN
jgi:guanylate kinase